MLLGKKQEGLPSCLPTAEFLEIWALCAANIEQNICIRRRRFVFQLQKKNLFAIRLLHKAKVGDWEQVENRNATAVRNCLTTKDEESQTGWEQ